MSSAPTLEVVIVSYRCEELLRRCLESVEAHVPVGTVIHVVDNASDDGTAEMVAREFPAVRLLACERNLGFGAANNLVLRELEAPYALVLNPDTRLVDRGLDRLLELMQARPEAGICGPRLFRENGALDHAARRSFPTPASALGHFTGLGRRRRAGSALSAYRAPGLGAGPIDAVNGAFMLIRREALIEVGPFDERYWMYMEDLDICYRFARAGWLTWYEPSVGAVHLKGGATGGARGPRLQAAFHGGMLRFYRDHYAPGRNPAINAAVYAGIATKLGLSLAGGAQAPIRRLLGSNYGSVHADHAP